MLIQTHKVIGESVLDALRDKQSIQLDRTRFILGNIVPDLHVDYIHQKHYSSQCYEKIKRAIMELPDKNLTLKQFSFRSGIICHYLSDFFCYPHDQEWHYGGGNTKEHIIFEEKQYQICKGNIIRPFERTEIETLTDEYLDLFLKNMLQEYHRSVDYSRDLSFALNASISCVRAMLERRKISDSEVIALARI